MEIRDGWEMELRERWRGEKVKDTRENMTEKKEQGKESEEWKGM